MNKKFIKRNLLSGLIDHLSKPEISLIVGPRQVGKTAVSFLPYSDLLAGDVFGNEVIVSGERKVDK